MGWFPLGNGVCLIMKKAPSDSPIWQLKKRELLMPLSFQITKPLKLDLSNLPYRPHYKANYRTQGCVIRENNITTQLWTPLRTPITHKSVPAWLNLISSLWCRIENVNICWFFTQNSQNWLIFKLNLTRLIPIST